MDTAPTRNGFFNPSKQNIHLGYDTLDIGLNSEYRPVLPEYRPILISLQLDISTARLDFSNASEKQIIRMLGESHDESISFS